GHDNHVKNGRMVSGRRARIRKANFASYDAAPYMPSLGRAMAIGYYPRGCLQGGIKLPHNGADLAGDASIS
ncbi:MAG: hypothetical protein WCC54_23945, partial [Pseudolabrys sp.]